MDCNGSWKNATWPLVIGDRKVRPMAVNAMHYSYRRCLESSLYSTVSTEYE